ncbi:hypothetical protein [Nonomuraea fuscirosea]|uniref:hypothetical protein n=1 Tax=Nonomuraea fuscirosea TaxID=1291556 RepID=UPI00342A25EC
MSQVRLAQHLGIRDKNKISKELRGDYLPAWEYVEPNYLIPIEEISGRLLPAETIAQGRLLYTAAEQVAIPHLPIPREQLEAQVLALMRRCGELTQQVRDTAQRQVELQADLAAARAEIAAAAQQGAEELAQVRARGQALEGKLERYRELLTEMREQVIARDAELTRLNADLQLAQTSAGYAVELEAELRRLREGRALVGAVADGPSPFEVPGGPGERPLMRNPGRAAHPAGPDDSRLFWKDGMVLDMRALTPILRLDRQRTTALATVAAMAKAAAIVLIAAGVLAAIVLGPPFWLWGWKGGVLTALTLLLLMASDQRGREVLSVMLLAVGDALFTLSSFVVSAPVRLAVYLISTLRTTRPVPQPRLVRVLAPLIGDGFYAWYGALVPDSVTGALVACRSGLYMLIPQQARQPDVTVPAAAITRMCPISIGDVHIPVTVVAIVDFAVSQDLALNGVRMLRNSQVRRWITQRPATLTPQILDRITASGTATWS